MEYLSLFLCGYTMVQEQRWQSGEKRHAHMRETHLKYRVRV